MKSNLTDVIRVQPKRPPFPYLCFLSLALAGAVPPFAATLIFRPKVKSCLKDEEYFHSQNLEYSHPRWYEQSSLHLAGIATRTLAALKEGFSKMIAQMICFVSAFARPFRLLNTSRALLLAAAVMYLPVLVNAQGQSPFYVISGSTQPVNGCQPNSENSQPSGQVSNSQCSPAPSPKKLPVRIVPFHDPNGQDSKPSLLTQALNAAPAGAHLAYNGGPVISNVKVVVVYWGNNVDPVVTQNIVGFYNTVLDSTYLDLLYEYSTVGVNYKGTSTNQQIGHGSVLGAFTITPSVPGKTITDDQVQTELQAQIAGGNLPPVETDAKGQSNTLYTVYFPPGITISQGGTNSCQSGGFCAYHYSANASATDPKSAIFQYSVNPDFGPGSGCDSGCGNGSTEFDNISSVSSHELAESITDAQAGYAPPGPPLAWYDDTNGEVGDICNADQGSVTAHGKTYVIQNLWSNSQGNCVSGPGAYLTLAATPTSVTTGTDLPVTVTVNNSAGTKLPFFTGTVQFSSSDTNATLPSNYTFTTTDAGTHTFHLTFGTTGSQSLTATDADVPSIKGSLTETVTAGQQTPVITWRTPAPITYGTPLGASQLNAVANVAGSFSYNPAAGSVLSAGTHQLQATFTPTDTQSYKIAVATVNLVVNPATPTITWATPAAITYGTPLSSVQLNAAASLPGTYLYSPPATTVLQAGQQTLSLTFTPTDTTDYSVATKNVTLTVNPAVPTITFAAIAPQLALNTATLAATSNSGGALTFGTLTPAVCSVLGNSANFLIAGQCTLTATIAAIANYSTATVSQNVMVSLRPQAISFNKIPTSETQGLSLALTASATSGLPVGFASLTTSICTVASGTVNLLNPGTCTIQASQPGNSIYAATSVIQSTLVIPAFTITPNPPSETAYRNKVAAFLLQLQAASGFNGSVTLSCAGPSGSYCVDFPMNVHFNQGRALAITGIFFPAKTTPGTYTVTFTGTSGSVAGTGTASFIVK